MIVYSVGDIKLFQTRSDKPNEDWTGNAEFVIDETNEQNAELIAKINEYAPYFDYVTDDSGNLIDVIKTGEEPEPEPVEPNPIEELKKENAELKLQLDEQAAIINTLLNGED